MKWCTRVVIARGADDDLVEGAEHEGWGGEGDVGVALGHDTEAHLHRAIGAGVQVVKIRIAVAGRGGNLAS